MICCISFFTINLVPLHNLGASKFRISIIGALTFRIKLWASKSGVWIEFKNLMGYCTASSSLRMQSMDLHLDYFWLEKARVRLEWNETYLNPLPM
ncbi:hypothetical protein TNIN_210711 [Trichonephila inaurata madagascariensis]|uniref:Uncharacterized protein n=1 Tax=Trichonephila inaurata madagascariensis TaxID=2747483 RepID=A0A8X6Y355_9ARAC|nr:hypothetical protein TNIN_210711 [Trichonephila inaurata madagascariensis]